MYVAWADNTGPNYTVRVRRSVNRGVDWSGDLLTADNATMACLAINSAGVVGLMYQQVVGSNWETHFRRTTDGTGTAWSDLVLNRSASATPVASFQPYLGDWARIVAVGRTFSGVFCANNTPDPANFPQGVSYLRNRSDDRAVQPARLGQHHDGGRVDRPVLLPGHRGRRCHHHRPQHLRRGRDRRHAAPGQPGGDPGAFYVVVDGFRADDLGITAATLSGIPDVAPSLAPSPG